MKKENKVSRDISTALGLRLWIPYKVQRDSDTKEKFKAKQLDISSGVERGMNASLRWVDHFCYFSMIKHW